MSESGDPRKIKILVKIDDSVIEDALKSVGLVCSELWWFWFLRTKMPTYKGRPMCGGGDSAVATITVATCYLVSSS